MLHEGHYTHQYFDIKPGHVRRPEAAIRWSEGLPSEWREQVIAPLYFDHYKEYLVKAARILGRDEDDQACYCAFCYVLEEEPDPTHPDPAAGNLLMPRPCAPGGCATDAG
jgi:hypothetical protein